MGPGRQVPAGGRASPGPAPSSTGRILLALGCLVVAITPARVALSQQNLNQSVNAFQAGDCGSAIDHALASASALNQRPEPFEVLGYCDMRIGRPGLAVRVMQSAVDRDPRRLGVPLRACSSASEQPGETRVQRHERRLRLNPRNQLLQSTLRSFEGARPREWPRIAGDAPKIPSLSADPR